MAENHHANALANEAWMLIADGEKALFLKNDGDAEYPVFRVIRKLEQENPPTREQAANNPGRFNDGPSTHRSKVQDTDWHELAKERFADELAEILYRCAHKRLFSRIILVAAPQVLGQLRKSLHKEVAAKVVGEIPKDLTNHSLDEMERIIMADLAQT